MSSRSSGRQLLKIEARAADTICMTFKLDNARQRHAEHPDTFEIPDATESEHLLVGQYAKLIFQEAGHGERMWVRVTEVTASGYIGELDNDPALVSSVRCGEPVVFGAEHVISVMD